MSQVRDGGPTIRLHVIKKVELMAHDQLAFWLVLSVEYVTNIIYHKRSFLSCFSIFCVIEVYDRLLYSYTSVYQNEKGLEMRVSEKHSRFVCTKNEKRNC